MRWLVSLAGCLAALFASADVLRAGRLPQQTDGAPRAAASAERATLDRFKIAEGIQRGMNIVSSPPTAEAIRLVLTDKR